VGMQPWMICGLDMTHEAWGEVQPGTGMCSHGQTAWAAQDMEEGKGKWMKVQDRVQACTGVDNDMRAHEECSLGTGEVRVHSHGWTVWATCGMMRPGCGVDEDVGMECHVQVGAGVCSHG